MTADFLLYLKQGANTPSSSTPIADYLNNAEPESTNSILIRKAKLKYKHAALPVNASYPMTFNYKMKFRKPITFNQNTQLILSERNTSTSKNIDYQWFAVFRK